MLKVILALFFSLSAWSQDYTQSSCYQQYQSLYRHKFIYNFHTAFDVITTPSVIVYEKQVLEALDYNEVQVSDLTSSLSVPRLLLDIRSTRPHLSFKEIQHIMQMAVTSNQFCPGPGIQLKPYEIVAYFNRVDPHRKPTSLPPEILRQMQELENEYEEISLEEVE